MSRLKKIALLTVIAVLIAIGLTLRSEIDRETVANLITGLGPWAGLAFIGAYAAGAVAFLPGLVFTITGGALFGPVLGTLYSLIGATLGGTLAFLAARHGLGDWVATRTGQRLERLQRGIDREGWRFVALMRLVPLVPFNLLNYALGLTRVGVTVYVVTSFIAMAPGALAYVWVGHAGRQALAGGGNVVQSVLIALALIAVLAFVPRLVRSLRNDAEV
ncbi:TVP38/TMEM64 family protein [Spiribacter vilamensis]|uniref:TVP38/TMEM64 family membrane protein n=1 Tax=Spiribacter vilamensis TaxID=531306 RepID=A0A4Q8CZD8_9GAMM|nr:TVP38/TMEM64 family protein [Spiribacter vilamensis]RZU98379.1 putative membrane protein YdjX (TVP38/TMEM64 family) [Spiribacter vilamensis]TVO60739.1 TVP38/TMEM64 family protein [Spiribacter vilamensis]